MNDVNDDGPLVSVVCPFCLGLPGEDAPASGRRCHACRGGWLDVEDVYRIAPEVNVARPGCRCGVCEELRRQQRPERGMVPSGRRRQGARGGVRASSM